MKHVGVWGHQCAKCLGVLKGRREGRWVWGCGNVRAWVCGFARVWGCGDVGVRRCGGVRGCGDVGGVGVWGRG